MKVLDGITIREFAERDYKEEIDIMRKQLRKIEERLEEDLK